jgi:hypothetical protein
MIPAVTDRLTTSAHVANWCKSHPWLRGDQLARLDSSPHRVRVTCWAS